MPQFHLLGYTRGRPPTSSPRPRLCNRSSPARIARELVRETEARAYMPPILEEEARLAQLEGDDAGFQEKLRQAHRLFTEMGATGHAERVARELGGAS